MGAVLSFVPAVGMLVPLLLLVRFWFGFANHDETILDQLSHFFSFELSGLWSWLQGAWRRFLVLRLRIWVLFLVFSLVVCPLFRKSLLAFSLAFTLFVAVISSPSLVFTSWPFSPLIVVSSSPLFVFLIIFNLSICLIILLFSSFLSILHLLWVIGLGNRICICFGIDWLLHRGLSLNLNFFWLSFLDEFLNFS